MWLGQGQIYQGLTSIQMSNNERIMVDMPLLGEITPLPLGDRPKAINTTRITF